MSNRLILPALAALICAGTAPRPVAAQDGCIPGRACTTAKTGNAAANRHAVVVGISKYKDKGVKQLTYADADAIKFAKHLVDDGIVAKDNMVVLLNDQATKDGFRRALQQKHQATVGVKDAEVIIYFAGHANTEVEIGDAVRAFLLMHEVSSGGSYDAGGFDFALFRTYIDQFAKSKTRVIVILDACRSGEIVGGHEKVVAAASVLSEEIDSDLIVKYSSSKKDQLSLEGAAWGGGVFTHFLLKGWSGAAAEPQTGVLTSGRLAFWTKEQVTKANPKQSPVSSGNEDLTLAVFTPAQIASALQQVNAPGNTQDTVVASRLVEPRTVIVPDALKPMRDAFNTALRAGRFRPDATRTSAWDIYHNLPTDSAANGLRFMMRFALAEALEAAPREVVFRYLEGGNDQPSHKVFDAAARDLGLAIQLSPADDPARASMQAEHLFLEAYAVLRHGDRPRYAQAIEKLQRARKLLPDASYITNAIGLAYINLDRFEEAEQAILETIRLSPGWTYPRNLLGMLRERQRRYEDAIGAYQAALALDSTAYYALNNLGNVYWSLGRYQQAEHLYRRSMLADSTKGIAHANLANLYRDKSRLTEALAESSIALRKDSLYADQRYWVWPKLVHAWTHRDLAKLALSNEQRVEETLKAAQTQAPFDGQPLSSLADLYKLQHKWDEAEAHYKRAMEIDPAHVWSYDGLANLYLYNRRKQTVDLAEQRRWIDRGEEVLRRGIRNAAHAAVPLANLGHYFFNAAEFTNERERYMQRADSAYRASQRLDSLNLDIYHSLAALDEARSNRAAAERWLRHAERIGALRVGEAVSATSPLPATWLAQFFYRDTRPAVRSDSAIAAYRRAIALDSTYALAQHELGSLLLQQGDDATAEKHMSIASRLGFRETIEPATQALDLKANALNESDPRRAIELLQTALRLDRADPEIWYELAVRYLRQGDLNTAFMHADSAYQRSVARDDATSWKERYLTTLALIDLERSRGTTYLAPITQLGNNISPATRLTRALLLHADGQTVAAVALYNAAAQRLSRINDAEWLAQQYRPAIRDRIAALRKAAQQ